MEELEKRKKTNKRSQVKVESTKWFKQINCEDRLSN
jgi:hypothetical protein